MTTIEERFQAAVNVIKGLPKNGPYQPSTAMMLKFYGLFKQATEGTCPQKKPAFWDIVGKAKWDAWNDNRHLSKDEAMQRYVDGLREIIETMSFTENVQNFVGSISGLDNIDLDELEKVAPGMREIAESHPNSPFNSRTNSPQHGVSANNSAEELHAVPSTNGHSEPHLSIGDDASVGSNTVLLEFNAGSDIPLHTSMVAHDTIAPTYSNEPTGTTEQSDDEYGDPIDLQHDLSEAMVHNSELLKQIQATVLRMNADLVAVHQRMTSLEKLLTDVRCTLAHKGKSSIGRVVRQYPKWWPFDDISPAWFMLLIVWPFVVKRISRMLAATPRRK